MSRMKVINSFWPAGDGSTLDLDFTQMSTLADLTSRGLTFSRSTSGTFINASGLVATATAGNPRFDYDTNGNPRGLLMEAAAGNLALQSNGAVSAWVIGTGRTPTNDTTDLFSPDGTNNATKLVCGTAGGYASHAQIVSGLTGGATYTVSYWIRGPVGHTPRLYAVNGTVGDVTPTSTTGTYNNTSWTRITQTYTLPATTTQVYVYFLSATIGATGDTFYVYGFQLETGRGASSLIPTAASTGNRAADSCVMTGTNFSSWFAGATEGVLWAECERPRKIESPAADHGIVGSRYQSGGWLGIGATATNQYPSSILWPTGGFQFAGGIATRIPLVSKQAVRWFNANDITNFSNGTQGVTNTAGTGSVTPAMLTIGANSTSGLAGNLEWLNGCVRRVKFWPVALPDSQIIALTT